MRALKLVGIVLGGVVVLIAVLLLAVKLFVNPNDYKDRIAQEVRSSTGRELALSGPIKLSVFPWIALEVGPASLGNPPGFSAEPFAAVQHVAFRVKLLPLLRKELQVGRIEIDGLDLRLRKNAAGKGNWEDFGGNKSAPESPANPDSGPTALPDLAGLEIKDSSLSYQDMSATHVNLELGHVTADTPIPLKLRLDLTTAPGAKPITLNGTLQATLNPRQKQYRIGTLDLDGTVTPGPAGAAPIPWKFSVPELSIDLAAQTLSAPAFSAELAAAHLGGSVQGSKILDTPGFSGTFQLDPVGLRPLMEKLGMTPPQMRDSQALTKLAAKGNFKYGANTASATGLDIQLDDSRLTGRLALTNLQTKAAEFNLAVDHIDLDHYRAPEQSNPKPPSQPAKPSAGPSDSGDAFKTLDLHGTLAIGSATVSDIKVTQVAVTVAAKDGVAHIAPAKAQLYGGNYTGDITVDERGTTPSLKLDQSMTGIDLGQMLKDFAKTQRVSGRGTVTTNLTSHALAGDALLKTLNGHIAANVDNGAVEGVDLWFEINRATALIQKQGMPSGQSSGRTRFDTFKASADITDGVASTRDLNIVSQNLRVTGQGTTNLVSNAIDYKVKATVLKEAPGAAAAAAAAAGRTLADIPLNITGTISSPSVRPDLQELAKAQVQQQLDKHKDELQQKLTDKLKGLFK